MTKYHSIGYNPSQLVEKLFRENLVIGVGVAINHETLEALREFQTEGEPDFLTELIDAYLGDSPQRLISMKTALTQKDVGAFAKAAHALKGSSGNLGAEILSSLCLKGEQFGKKGDLLSAQDLFPKIEDEYQIVSSELTVLRRP